MNVSWHKEQEVVVAQHKAKTWKERKGKRRRKNEYISLRHTFALQISPVHIIFMILWHNIFAVWESWKWHWKIWVGVWLWQWHIHECWRTTTKKMKEREVVYVRKWHGSMTYWRAACSPDWKHLDNLISSFLLLFFIFEYKKKKKVNEQCLALCMIREIWFLKTSIHRDCCFFFFCFWCFIVLKWLNDTKNWRGQHSFIHLFITLMKKWENFVLFTKFLYRNSSPLHSSLKRLILTPKTNSGKYIKSFFLSLSQY